MSKQNYIYPFFWLHSEDETTLREYVNAVYSSHIYALCVESRPHPDFVGDKWWQDMEIIFDEAAKLGMQVWILDDAHFPTGIANRRLEREPVSRRKIFLDQWHIQTSGPRKNARFRFNDFVRINPDGNGETLLAIVALKLMPDGKYDSPILLTQLAKDGLLYWDVPDGEWRIYYIKETKYADDDPYINTIDPASTDLLIDEVYESHYQHFSRYFGNTLAGFFSDEPLLGNPSKGSMFENRIGQPFTKLPWRKGLLTEILEDEPQLLIEELPYIWVDGPGEITAKVRCIFMDKITALYGRHFCKRIGDWCHEHGVKYIGHIIEDNNSHARLGCTAGHYFRALSGQDMSGMDVVLNQLMPGDNSGFLMGPPCWWADFEWDEEFFHFAIAKLASSFAHIDPIKQGRAMCEIFGAYGWGEGLSFMTWLTNHMLVNGINNFVPHAFSLKDFPDSDCPPHFYAHGHNPQYRYFGILMDYMNRICHRISDGKHLASVAVLYHAEAEWAGGEAMLVQKPIRMLTEAQIDCDILPIDAFVDTSTEVEKLCMFGGQKVELKTRPAGCGGLDAATYIEMNGEQYGALIIPACDYLPDKFIVWLDEAKNQGLPIYHMGKHKPDDIIKQIDALGLRDIDVTDLAAKKSTRDLRFYHYKRNGVHSYMFFNSSPCLPILAEIDTHLFDKRTCDSVSAASVTSDKSTASGTIDTSGNGVIIYNAFADTYSHVTTSPDGKFLLTLAPQEAKFFTVGDADGCAVGCTDGGAVGDLPEYIDVFALVAKENGLFEQPNVSLDSEQSHSTKQNLPAELGSSSLQLLSQMHDLHTTPIHTNSGWCISIATAEQYPCFKEYTSKSDLFDFLEREPNFSGTIRYESEFDLASSASACHQARVYLDLGEVYEAVDVCLNGVQLQPLIAAPYIFEVTDIISAGRNSVTIDVTTHLEADQQDGYSAFITLTPNGMLGPVCLHAVR